MSVLNRLRTSLNMISPDGDVYEGKWRGNARELSKKTGLFNFPKVKGTKGQDLDVNGDVYPLTIYFDGPDNDLISDDFFQSLKQNGKWEIVHPLYGALFLQLVGTARQDIQPIDSVSFTTFETNWIETLPDGSEISLAELLGLLDNQAVIANAAAAEQFESNAFLDTFAQIKALTATVGQVVNAVKKNIRLVENFSIVPSEIDAIVRGIESTIASLPPDLSALAGQIQALIQIPVLAQDNVIGALDTFSTFADSLSGLVPSVADKEGVNTVSVQELALSAGMVAVSQSASLAGIETRTQAVETADSILQFFTDITNTLDATQELYESVPIEFQYYSQSQSYSANRQLAAQAAQYLLVSAINLKIERRFKIQVPRSFLEICGDEYESVDDEVLDFFIETNKLKNMQIRAPLPALTEVVVFV